jgi:hypothetical protein
MIYINNNNNGEAKWTKTKTGFGSIIISIFIMQISRFVETSRQAVWQSLKTQKLMAD